MTFNRFQDERKRQRSETPPFSRGAVELKKDRREDPERRRDERDRRSRDRGDSRRERPDEREDIDRRYSRRE